MLKLLEKNKLLKIFKLSDYSTSNLFIICVSALLSLDVKPWQTSEVAGQFSQVFHIMPSHPLSCRYVVQLNDDWNCPYIYIYIYLQLAVSEQLVTLQNQFNYYTVIRQGFFFNTNHRTASTNVVKLTLFSNYWWQDSLHTDLLLFYVKIQWFTCVNSKSFFKLMLHLTFAEIFTQTNIAVVFMITSQVLCLCYLGLCSLALYWRSLYQLVIWQIIKWPYYIWTHWS